MCSGAGVSLPQILGVTELKDKEVKATQDPIEEQIVSNRDKYTVSERAELRHILGEIEKLAEEEKEMQVITLHSTPHSLSPKP